MNLYIYVLINIFAIFLVSCSDYKITTFIGFALIGIYAPQFAFKYFGVSLISGYLMVIPIGIVIGLISYFLRLKNPYKIDYFIKNKFRRNIKP